MENPLDDYTGNINLHPDDKRYQFLMASQNYGTLYGVFGNFTIEIEEDKYYLTQLDLKIVNYKGLLNIGFALNKNLDLAFNGNNEVKMDVSVQGLSNVYMKQADIKSRIDVTHIKKMKFNRVLNFLVSDVLDLNESGVFDNEFYYRDGIQTSDERKPESRKRPSQPGMVNYDNQPVNYDSEKLISRNCHTSILYVTKVDPSEFQA